MAIAIMIATTPAILYVIKSAVVAALDCGVLVGALVGAGSTAKLVSADDG